jgi:putative selenate reductase
LIIIHILRDKFGWNNSPEPGVIFNMSVGYNLQGILNKNVQWFFAKMTDASLELKQKIESIKLIYPNIINLNINPCISDNITLSTMHGCPADEIETIGEYLIENKKLHTAIKLNPTLLGKEKLHEILKKSGFETQVPDIAFEHDLKYIDALQIVNNLQQKANKNNLQFSIKLTNTLESLNNKEVFKASEEMMYMSGKALHPISINLAAKLQSDFNGKLDISFSGGADALNVADIVNCGLAPVTVCTDLLKPGGYGRLNQYINILNRKKPDTQSSTLEKLKDYANEVMNNSAYKKAGFTDPSIKTTRQLNYFDCIHAPCIDTCPTNQDIPNYLYYTSIGEFNKAAEIIQQTNPFPHTTGMVCDHLCQTKCTRINYDSPLLIREIKRFVAENYINEVDSENIEVDSNDISVSIIGAGPSGLSCAYFLAKAGMKVNIYESKSKAGGMVQGAIPYFRLTDKAIDIDINSILKLGVVIQYDYEVNKQIFSQLQNNSDFIYIGTGARKSHIPDINGIKSKGVLDPLDFLFDVKNNTDSGIGKNVVIIGGGNTAMDAARTAYRLVGKNGKVTIIYRRTIKQMPADLGEIKAVIEEGIEIIELVSPTKINAKNGVAFSVSCKKMKLGGKDSSGRATPIEIPNSYFEIELDTLIPAIGQEIDIDFANASQLATKNEEYETQLPNVFIGGDALRGASTAINAIGDGRKAAQEIIDKANIDFDTKHHNPRIKQDVKLLMINKTKRKQPQKVYETNLDDRQNFKLVTKALTKEEAIKEASRCLLCDEVCNICTTVCPNLAFHSYEIQPVSYNIQKIASTNGITEITEYKEFKIKQKTQIIHLADWCNQCGNCDTFCPSAGSPYIDKPHLYLVKEAFDNDRDGCFLDTKNGAPTLIRYFNKQKYSLTQIIDVIYFETDNCILKLENESMRIIEVEVKENSNFEEDLTIAAEMRIIMRVAIDFLNIK